MESTESHALGGRESRTLAVDSAFHLAGDKMNADEVHVHVDMREDLRVYTDRVVWKIGKADPTGDYLLIKSELHNHPGVAIWADDIVGTSKTLVAAIGLLLTMIESK